MQPPTKTCAPQTAAAGTALLDLFHPHAHLVELLDQVAHRARDRVGHLGVIQLHHVVARGARYIALDHLAGNSD